MILEYATLATMHGATVNSYEQVHRTACRSLFMSFIHLNGEVATRQEIDDQEACAGQHQHCPWNTFPRLLKVVLSFPWHYFLQLLPVLRHPPAFLTTSISLDSTDLSFALQPLSLISSPALLLMSVRLIYITIRKNTQRVKLILFFCFVFPRQGLTM